MSSLLASRDSNCEVVGPLVIFSHDDKAAISLRCACALEHSLKSNTELVRFTPTFGGDEKHISEDISTEDVRPVIQGRGIVEIFNCY